MARAALLFGSVIATVLSACTFVVTPSPTPTPPAQNPVATSELPISSPEVGPTSTPSSELTPTPIPPTLDRIQIDPRQVVLEPGQSYVFTINALDTEGQIISYLATSEVSWSARGESGTIDSMGSFRATTKAGVYGDVIEVTVYHEGVTAMDTAEIVVMPGPLSSLTLTPTSLTTEVGGQLQILVKGMDAYGNEIPDLNLEWRVDPSAGTIETNTGGFSAGTKAGEFPNAVRVVADYKEARLEAMATMTVEPGPLSNLMLTPTAITTEVQRSVQFTVQGTDDYGNEVPSLDPVWEVLDSEVGVIDQAFGLFSTGTRAGEYHNAVRVIGSYKEVYQEATAEVIVEPGPLASLALVPPTITTQVLQEGQFEVKGTDDYGNEIPDLNLAWQVDPAAGTLNQDVGTFSAGTRAGDYSNAIKVLGSYKGVSREALASILVEPGPIQQAMLSASTSQIFTGDSVLFTVAALDAFGNPIANPEVAWSASLGEVDSSGGFTAGREGGTGEITVIVTDGESTVQASGSVDIRMGYCDSNLESAIWELEWYKLNNDRSMGEFLGTSQASGNLNFDWGFGTVFQGRSDWLMLIARTTIVVQREGPVLFQISKDDGAKLFLDGSLVMENSNYRVPLSKSVTLAPGTYNLELQYHEIVGNAFLDFQTDQDVLQWMSTTQCYGGFTQPLDTRYFVHRSSGTAVEEIASRFGVSSEEVSALNKVAGRALLLPGDQANANMTKVIVIRGIDSSSSCSEKDGTLGLRHLMVRTVQNSRPGVNGVVSQVDDSDIVAFSYSGEYVDCNTGQQYTAHDFPGVTVAPDIQRSSLLPLTPAPAYSKDDTCLGIRQASQHLEALVNQILRLEPDARFVIIGHSLGGMVAGYYVSQQPAAFVEEKIQKVVTVDSPLLGFSEISPASACLGSEQSWQDILGKSDAVPTIRQIQGQPSVKKFYAINSTDIGDTLTETDSMSLGCASVRTAGGAWGGSFLSALAGLAIGGPGGFLAFAFGSGVAVSAYGEGHSCAFADETALSTISQLVNIGT